jgi:hypothetical protein
MSVKIQDRKIIELRKRNGSKQYVLTIPVEYARNLKLKGIDTLLVISDYGLGVFPKEDKAEKALLQFFENQKELQAIVSKQKPGTHDRNRQVTIAEVSSQ